jgi:hypothetical protein
MRVFGISLALVCIGFLVHWLVWRVSIPRRQTAALLLIFFAVFAAGIGGFLMAHHAGLWWGLRTPWECLHVGIFSISVALAYVVVYSALEERSPSMTILSFVNSAKPAGRTKKALEGVLRNASPVEIRLAAMTRDMMVTESSGMCELTPKGRAWATLFERVRMFLGFSRGG